MCLLFFRPERQDPFGYFDPLKTFFIFFTGEFFEVIHGKPLVIAFADQGGGGFVIGYGRFGFSFIAADDELPPQMDPRLIDRFSLVLFAQYAVIAVDDLDVFIAEVPFVPIDEQKIPSGDAVIFNPVAGQDIDLHAVVADEQMTAAAYDRMGGVVKQVVYIKCVVIVGGKIVVEIIFPHVYRRFDVDSVVAEIDERHPFGKGERRGAPFGAFIFE